MKKDEVLFVGTAEAEHVEMYLKAIWHIKESGDPVKISTISKMLNVRQPSVVQMLKKLNESKLVNYNKTGVSLTKSGEQVGTNMMRNQAARCLWFVWQPTHDCVTLLAFHDSPNRIFLLLLMSVAHDVRTKKEVLFFRLPSAFHYQHSRISGKSRSLSGIRQRCKQAVLHLPYIMPATQ